MKKSAPSNTYCWVAGSGNAIFASCPAKQVINLFFWKQWSSANHSLSLKRKIGGRKKGNAKGMGQDNGEEKGPEMDFPSVSLSTPTPFPSPSDLTLKIVLLCICPTLEFLILSLKLRTNTNAEHYSSSVLRHAKNWHPAALQIYYLCLKKCVLILWQCTSDHSPNWTVS